MNEKETVGVTIRVPKKLMDMLEAEHYFGWKKEEFFVAAVKDCISAEVSELGKNETKRLYEKYGRDFDIGVVRIVEIIEKSLAY